MFGDFDVDEIEENSPDHTNAILFLVYLFVAVFILLSMFLAILADAQSTVTTNEDWEKIEETSLTDSLKKDFRSARDSLVMPNSCGVVANVWYSCRLCHVPDYPLLSL